MKAGPLNSKDWEMLKKSLLLVAPFLLTHFAGNALTETATQIPPAATTQIELTEKSNKELLELINLLRTKTEQENQRHLKAENRLFWGVVGTAAILLAIDGLLLLRKSSAGQTQEKLATLPDQDDIETVPETEPLGGNKISHKTTGLRDLKGLGLQTTRELRKR